MIAAIRFLISYQHICTIPQASSSPPIPLIEYIALYRDFLYEKVKVQIAATAMMP